MKDSLYSQMLRRRTTTPWTMARTRLSTSIPVVMRRTLLNGRSGTDGALYSSWRSWHLQCAYKLFLRMVWTDQDVEPSLALPSFRQPETSSSTLKAAPTNQPVSSSSPFGNLARPRARCSSPLFPKYLVDTRSTTCAIRSSSPVPSSQR